MLTAWETSNNKVLALPDFRRETELEIIRERTRRGELICRTCREALWLHAGAIRTPHFAHRSLQNCPAGRASEAVLAGRDFLYWFFKPRIESGKLKAQIELEPEVPDLPERVTIDLLLRRSDKPPVAIVLFESGLRPHLRIGYPATMDMRGWVFRPVFLNSRLKREENSVDCFLLGVTERAYIQPSPYDLAPPEFAALRGSLHFVDCEERKWVTLRSLALVHRPQVYRARTVRISKEADLLWSEAHAEWVHKGEAEALKAFLRPAKKTPAPPAPHAQHSIKEASSALSGKHVPAEEVSLMEKRTEAVPPSLPPQTDQSPAAPGEDTPPPIQTEAETASASTPFSQPEPVPAWVRGALVCVGCGKPTPEWQNARPMRNECVCRKCFARGVRLPK